MDEASADLVERYRQGDETAADALYARYIERLRALARSQMSQPLKRRVDADDVMQSVFASFFVHARENRYTFSHSGDLWRLLATITFHKVQRQVEVHRAGKRDYRKEQPLADGQRLSEVELTMLAREPSSQEAEALREKLEIVMSLLRPQQRSIVQMLLQEHTQVEVAAALHCSERTVRRAVEKFRELVERL